jgi:phage terminase large subunit-like protein
MLQQNPVISKRVKKRKYDLYNASQFNTMKPLANNSNLDGLNTDIFLCDEIHEFSNAVMFDLIQQSQGVKLEPLIFITTTNGFVRDAFFDTKLEYANHVLNDVINDHTFLPILYELDSDNAKDANEEIKDKRNWQKTLPALGEFRSYADVDKLIKQTECNKVERSKLLAKYFNLPQSDVQGWLNYDEAHNDDKFDLEEFRGCYCIGGADLSAVGDLTTATLLFMRQGCDCKYIWQKSFMPGDLLEEREKSDKVPYSKWVERGFIDLSGDTKINYSDVTNWFKYIVHTYNLYPRWIGFDNWNSQYWIDEMSNEGFTLENVIQGFKTFSNPLKELTADFKAHRIIYNNNPVLKWAILNTKIKIDENDNWRPVKGKGLRQRIDPMVSMLDAYVVLSNKYQDFTNLL